jgi:hypothetical protein
MVYSHLEGNLMFTFHDLDATSRKHMLEEANLHGAHAMEYFGKRLTATGQADWPNLLREAIRTGTPESLAAALRINGRPTAREMSQRKGVRYAKAVPSNAAELRAEGEFNRYNYRALCLRDIAEKRSLTVDRGQHSDNPRPESGAWIGKQVDPNALLKDLRENTGGAPAMGLPSVNSGLTVGLS